MANLTPMRAQASPDATRSIPHILFFEPSWLDRLRGSATIRRANARVLSAARVDQAIHHLNTARVDIALLDLDFSQGRHDVLLCMLHERAPEAYVVASSATASDADMEACFARGFDDFVPKPLAASRLRIVIDAAADAHRASSVSRAVPIRNNDDFYSPELHAQLLVHLREETDKLYTMLSTSTSLGTQLHRRMHRIRSGLLLLGLRPLADECRDLERDCELPHVDDGVLRRRGWRIARQMRALSAPATTEPLDTAGGNSPA
ncbi:response regulator [Pigmentiphaga litoralis]|uniref:response regulator n=1 Tax=Pigmentiphaga litoralis TaxID=516702 RepID=UPI0016732364|nr:response regulator [Pigmentiphaga litoralis]